MESASPARYRASLFRAEEGTIMGTISPRVRRSAACTASRIFLRSSSENIFISPAPGGAPAAETSPASAETAAESASARKLAETSSTPAAESPWRTSAAARHPRQRHRDDQHDDRGDDCQDHAGREGQHEGHHASDGAAFPMVERRLHRKRDGLRAGPLVRRDPGNRRRGHRADRRDGAGGDGGRRPKFSTGIRQLGWRKFRRVFGRRRIRRRFRRRRGGVWRRGGPPGLGENGRGHALNPSTATTSIPSFSLKKKK